MLCAIYCRLSKEDEDKNIESESIQNQKSLLINYANEKGWDIYQIYCDEDYSGIDRDRPAFLKMIADAQNKKFNVILCKTQSRFTRDMELVEKYIHHLFIVWGIRFVTIVDHVDTQIKGNKKARQINGLINEWYLEDLSENIKAVLDHKRQTGQYIGSFPVYGYKKDPKDHNHLMIDEEAAQVVRKIFQLYLLGYGKQAIANYLNRENILNPAKYKQKEFPFYYNQSAASGWDIWNKTTIGRMLKNEMYIGNLVQGKRKKISYKIKKSVLVPRENWICIPHTHEPIIDGEAFKKVQLLLKRQVRKDKTGEVHSLAGLVYCMDCGSSMSRTSNTYLGEKRSYLQCKSYTLYRGKKGCSNHSVRLDLLTELVETKILECISQYGEIDKIKVDSGKDSRETWEKQIADDISLLKGKLERYDRALQSLYFDKVEGLIEKDQFMQMNSRILQEKRQLSDELAHLPRQAEEGQEEKNAANIKTGADNRIEEIKNMLQTRPIPRTLIQLLIDRIEISQKSEETYKRKIKIVWKF